MNERGNGYKVMGWVTLVFLIVFFVIGVGIVFGAFMPDYLFPKQGMRVLLGMLLIGYSAIRGMFVIRNLKA